MHILRLLLFLVLIISITNSIRASTYVVTSTTGDNGYAPSPAATTNNVTTGATIGYLGWAIASANAHAGADTITFNLPVNSVISMVNPNWYVFSDAAGCVMDGTIGSMAAAWTTAGSCKPIICINGNGNGYNPITLASNTAIKGFVFYDIPQVILMNNVTSCKIQGCYFGTDITGTIVNATGNPQQAIIVEGTSSLNLIGGTTCAQRNVFSGAYTQGIQFNTSATLNAISGNYIGVSSTGLAQLYNSTSVQGIYFNGAGLNNIISNNVISGYYNTGWGIQIKNTSNTLITGNYIGVDATGNNSAFSNTVGIETDGSSVRTKIGWYGAGNGNVVANSSQYGINCTAVAADSLYIINNLVGTNSSGIANASRYGNCKLSTSSNYGAANINVNTFTNVLVINNVVADAGPKASGAANISTGYNAVGVGIAFTAVSNATIQGNMIGVDITGNTALGNEDNGMSFISPCSNILVGGPSASQKNIIGANGYKNNAVYPYIQHGVQTTPGGTFSNFTFQNNNIGLGLNGTSNVGNYNMGLGLWSIANVTIMNNLISNNIWGIFLDGDSPGLVYNNTITNNDDLVANMEGGGIGVQGSGSTAIQIGSPTLGGNNIYNNKNGIWLRADGTDAAPSNITIQNNKIYSNNGITGVRPVNPAGEFGPGNGANGGNGIAITGTGVVGNNIIGNGVLGGNTANAPNQIYDNNNNGSNGNVNGSANGNGVYVYGVSQNIISQNSIYCNGQASVNGINLNLGSASPGNTGITNISGFTVPPYITNATGIQFANTPGGVVNATDVIEVFWDNSCGTCQGKTYLGYATNNAAHTAWSFTIPAIASGAFCTAPGSCATGVTNITSTRTDVNKNTSQFMGCTPLFLPVTIISFTANVTGKNSVQLNWTTADEKNNAYFEVSRSYDGKTYTPIGIVQGGQNSISALNYDFTDNSVDGAIAYYMLTQVDMDGKATIIGIREVDIDVTGQIIVSSYQGGIKVFNSTGSALESITLITAAGAEVYSTTSFDSDTVTNIPTSGLAAGVYLVKVLTGSQLTTKKAVIY